MNFTQKFDLLMSLKKQFACDSFVETGTYQAKMTLAMVNHFAVVRTIELEQSLYERAKSALSKYQGGDYHAFQGDSGTLLLDVLSDTKVGKPLVWLDAHWSDGITACLDEKEHTPILRELSAIKSSGKEAIVVIDDLHCFVGNNGYPTLKQLYELLEKTWPATITTRVDNVIWFVANHV